MSIITKIKDSAIIQKDWSLPFFCWVALILIIYGKFIFGVEILTTTNFMYFCAPWNSLGIDFFGPSLSDPTDSALPDIMQIYYRSQGDFSTWVSEVGLGSSVDMSNILSPLTILVYIFPLKFAILFKAILETSLAYFGIYLLCRNLQLCKIASLFGSVSYACSTAMVMWLFWPHTDVMAVAPWAILFAYNIINKQRIKDMLLMAIATFMMVVSGMLSFAGYVLYLVGFLVLFSTIVKYKKDIKQIIKSYVLFGLAAIIGVAVSSPYLVEMFDLVVDNGYAEARKGQATSILDTAYLRTLFYPYNRENLPIHINETTIFIGVVGLVFVAVCLINFKNIKHRYWTITFLLLPVLIFTHFLDSIYILMPAINTSNKYRLINIWALVMCIMAAQGFDLVCKNSDVLKSKLNMFVRYVVYVAIVIWSVKYVMEFPGHMVIKLFTETAILATMIAIEIHIFTKSGIFKNVVKVGLLAANIVCMSIFMITYLPGIDKDSQIIPPVTSSIKYLQENTDEERIYTVGKWVLFPNTNVFYDLNYITSHSAINTNEDVRNFLYVTGDQMRMSPTAYQGRDLDNYNLLKWAGVKFIVKEQTNEEVPITEGTKVYIGDDGLEIYQLDSYSDKIFLSEEVQVASSDAEILALMSSGYQSNKVYVEASSGYTSVGHTALGEAEELCVVEDSEDYIKVTAELDMDRFIVVNEYDDGKWKVYVDGKEAELVTVNYLFKGVYVPKGEHTVEFVYDTEKTLFKCRISLIVFFILIVITVLLHIREKKTVYSVD